MIIYTGIDGFLPVQDQPGNEFQLEIENNSSLIVQADSFNTVRVVRLLSSDPQMYLKPEYQPGNQMKVVLRNCSL